MNKLCGRILTIVTLVACVTMTGAAEAGNDASRQYVYDTACGITTEHNSDSGTAGMYFEKLSDSSNSATQPEKYSQILPIEATAEMPFVMTGNNFVLLQYTDYNVYRKDKTADEFFAYRIRLLNTGEEPVAIHVDLAIDGINYRLDDAVLQPGVDEWYTFNSRDLRAPFVVGEHHAVWYVNGFEYASYDYTVCPGNSGQKLDDEQTAKSLDFDFKACYVDAESQKPLEARGTVELQDISRDQLRDSEYYAPWCTVTNNGAETAEFRLTLCLDDESCSWDVSIEPGQTINYYIGSDCLPSGRHTVRWYDNNTLLGRETFTVHDVKAASN